MNSYTTFGIGGRVAELREITNYNELNTLIQNRPGFFQESFFLGRGSNLLLPEGEINTPFLRLDGDFKTFSFESELVRAGAATFLPKLSIEAARRGYEGLEWAAGVPGTVGGAIMMNAGAFDKETFKQLKEIRFLTREGKELTKTPSEIQHGYRSCELRNQALVMEAVFELQESTGANPLEKTYSLLKKRRKNQPVGKKSAGCIFKNVNGASAGELIDQAGLKEAREGSIQVSAQHANYFINTGGGQFSEVMNLIDRVRDKIMNEFDVELPLELQVWDGSNGQ